MRGRIRQLKPDLFLDEDFWELQLKHPGLPLLQGFQGLWCYADREGRFEWRPRMLKSLFLPYWDGDIESVLEVLLGARLIVRYEVAGRSYGAVRTFSKHQMPNNRENKSTLPPPDADALPEPDDGGYVYVASLPDGSAFKVGFSRRDPELRVNDLSNGSPEPLRLVEYIEGDYALETEIHRALADHRRHREWFTTNDDSVSILSVWFSRDPRVRDPSSTRLSPRKPLPPLPIPNSQLPNPTRSSGVRPIPDVPGLERVAGGGVARTYTMPSQDPPKEYLDVALMGGVRPEQARSTWKHYWGAGLPAGGVERLHDWLTQRAAERATQTASLPRARARESPVAELDTTGAATAFRLDEEHRAFGRRFRKDVDWAASEYRRGSTCATLDTLQQSRDFMNRLKCWEATGTFHAEGPLPKPIRVPKEAHA